MKFFEKLMIDEYNEWLNEGDDLSGADKKVLKRMYYKKIMNSDKSELDKLFKEFEKKQEQARKRQRFGFTDTQIDILKGWFGERAKQLGIKESFDFKLNEAKSKWAGPMLRRGISGDLSGAKLKSLRRVYYDVIMRSNKAQLDKLFKYIEELQKSKAKEFSDMEINQLKDWFDERLEQLGIKESYDFQINEAPIAAKGWDDSSIEKFGKTIGKDPKDKGFFDACVKRMSGKEGFDEQKAKGFCASIKDKAYGSPNWRGKGKTKEQAKKDTQKDKFKKE